MTQSYQTAMGRGQHIFIKVATATAMAIPAYFIIRHLMRRYTMVEAPWLSQSPRWNTADYKTLLLADKNVQPPAKITLSQLVEKSAQFPIEFPVETVRCDSLKKQPSVKLEELEKNINSAYPVIHEQALLLCAIFLAFQKKSGNAEFYKNMSLLDLVDRLLSKRAVCFVGRSDQYLLLSGEKGARKWETIGTDKERPPLILQDCLSYDEIKLSALLSVSSHTRFINNGSRTNFGKYDDSDRVEKSGVIVGLIGARLEKQKVMEYREILKTKDQNTAENGYGKNSLQSKFLEFYGDTDATYDQQVKAMKAKPDRYVDLGDGDYFDSLMFSRRIALSIDTLLLEANDRAKTENKKAYIHVVGLGLGVWKIYQNQDKIFMDTFAERVEALKDVLTDISDIRFAYIRHSAMGEYKDGDTCNGIKIHIENKDPQVKLEGEDEGKLLVVSYPWDGNAFPGNEFWFGKSQLAASGDPAAAASSQISELHNYYINENVRASNLRVATLKGVMTFEEYQKLHKND